MKLLQNFVFSQSSLRDFETCPKKFYLRYILNLPWPAQQTSESLQMEEHIRSGSRFHHLIHQFFLGIPKLILDKIALSDPYPEFQLWWENFQEFFAIEPENEYFSEITLLTPIRGSRLIAKFDLVRINGNKLIVYDWKTSQKQPKRDTLLNHIQTRVYLYTLTKEYASLVQANEIQPENIQMIYWQAKFSDCEITVQYSQADFNSDGNYLSDLIEKITMMEDEDFVKTQNDRVCRYCNYRSLCDKGISAGSLDEFEGEPDALDLSIFAIDLDQIEEIQY